MSYGVGPQGLPHSNVYVRNLPSDLDQTALENVFKRFGTIVGCKLFSNVAVPYAFVKFASVDEAAAAVQNMNGTSMGGKSLLVKVADMDASLTETPIDNLYIKNIPSHWNDDAVRQFFSAYGTIVSLKLLTPFPGATTQGALLRYETVDQAQAAKDSANGVIPQGESAPLHVKYADTPEDKQRKSLKASSSVRGVSGQRYAPYPSSSGPSASSYGGPDMGGRYVPPGGPGSAAVQAPGWPQPGAYTAVSAPAAMSNPYAAQTFSAYAAFPGADPTFSAGAAYDPYSLGMNGYAAATQYAQTAGMAPAGAAMYGAAPGAAASGPSMVVIRCLPPSVDRLKLYEAYAPYGGILSVIINPDRSAAIRYVDHTSARRATDSTNNTRLDGGVVYVELQP